MSTQTKVLAGNRAYRRKQVSLDRHQPERERKEKIENQMFLASEGRATKVKNRVAKVKARKAEREAKPKVAEKMKRKRLKKVRANKLRLEKRRAKKIKYANK